MIAFENPRTRAIKSSPSMAVSMAARVRRGAGAEVFDLSLGEPDFATPDHVIRAAADAMANGATRYTGPNGSAELRDAIVRKFDRENGLRFDDAEIAVGNGAKQILFDAFLATLELGDEVIIPAPYWVSYADMVELHGGVAKIVPTSSATGFKLTPDRLEEVVSLRSRWLLLNSPSNPSGAVYSRAELAALGEVVGRHPRLLVMSDEIYEHILVGSAAFTSFGTACPDLRERTLLINGVSKSYAMTGWRLGYAAGPAGLIAGLNKLQSQSTTCPSSISQAAACAALGGPQDFVTTAGAAYRRRCETTVAALGGIDGLRLVAPQGAFYAFPDCSAFIGRRTSGGTVIDSDSTLASYLLASSGVATVPGAAFGTEPFLRLSFTSAPAALERALERLTEGFDALR